MGADFREHFQAGRSIYLIIYLNIYPGVYLIVYLGIFPSICLSVCLSVNNINKNYCYYSIDTG